MWAFVVVPGDRRKTSMIHYWFADGHPIDQVALMLGHELGHIQDDGPHMHLTEDEEEDRADLYGDVAGEVMRVVLTLL
jgi:hypothetical protein